MIIIVPVGVGVIAILIGVFIYFTYAYGDRNGEKAQKVARLQEHAAGTSLD